MLEGLLIFAASIFGAYFVGRAASNNKQAVDMAEAVLKADEKGKEIHEINNAKPISELVDANNKRFSGDKKS
jgi:hypothetical protein